MISDMLKENAVISKGFGKMYKKYWSFKKRKKKKRNSNCATKQLTIII